MSPTGTLRQFFFSATFRGASVEILLRNKPYKQTMTELVELSTKTITIERNEFLKVKGSIDTNVYFVKGGSLRVFVLDDFEEQIIRFGYKENLIVALDSFLTGKPSNFFIQAIKKTELKVISKAEIDNF